MVAPSFYNLVSVWFLQVSQYNFEFHRNWGCAFIYLGLALFGCFGLNKWCKRNGLFYSLLSDLIDCLPKFN